MDLKIATDQDAQKWDEVVECSPNGELFHTWRWLKLIEEHSIQKIGSFQSIARLYPVFLMEKETIVGIFPLYTFQVPFIKFCFSPPPHVDTMYLGPLFPGINNLIPSKTQSFLEEVQVVMDQFIKKDLRANYVRLNTPPGYDDCRFFKWGGYESEPRYTGYIDLREGLDILWKNLSRSLRQAIERAKKEGLCVSEGNKDDVYYIFDLLKERNRISTSKQFLGAVYDAFSQDNLKIFIAKAGEKRLSGIILIIYKDKVTFWCGAPKSTYKEVTPNELLLWEAICWAESQGFKTFELEGADDFSLYPFKRKFNAKNVLYFQNRWFSPPLQMLSRTYHAFKRRDMNQLEL